MRSNRNALALAREGHLLPIALTTLIITAFALLWSATARAAGDRPASFLRHVSKELIAASKTRSPHILAAVIRRYGDVPDIGLYSLGEYRKKLPSNRRGSYYDGVARFMARYFLDQAKQYPIVKVDVYTPSRPADWGHKIDSKITLQSGSTYNIRWLVVPRGKGFKIRDVSILGFWMTPFQKRLFEGYIDDNGGKVSALLAALGG